MFQKSELVMLRWVCRSIILLTAIFSVWANVLHIRQFSWPALIFAAAPPLVVLGSFEMASRIPIAEERWWKRLPRPVVTGLISVGGAWLSYWHQKSAILRYNDGDEQNARILPLLIDGFMIVASVSVIELNRRIRAIDFKAAGIELSKAKAPETPREKPLTQKERIAVAVTEMPWANAKEIAAKAQVKETYAANIMSELRKTRTNGRTTVPANN